jgi:hypothetical protein
MIDEIEGIDEIEAGISEPESGEESLMIDEIERIDEIDSGISEPESGFESFTDRNFLNTSALSLHPAD